MARRSFSSASSIGIVRIQVMITPLSISDLRFLLGEQGSLKDRLQNSRPQIVDPKIQIQNRIVPVNLFLAVQEPLAKEEMLTRPAERYNRNSEKCLLRIIPGEQDEPHGDQHEKQQWRQRITGRAVRGRHCCFSC